MSSDVLSKFSPFTVIADHRYTEHDTGGGVHPEVPERFLAIQEHLQSSILRPMMKVVTPQSVDRRELLAFHDDSYLFRFEEAVLSGQTSFDHGDNQICYDSYQVALLSAAAGINGVDLLEEDQTDRVFCNVRPPGHHAERCRALGFCFFNNTVIAARYWQSKYLRRRVFIIDWDAHHGNGVQSAFEHDSDVFYLSIHEHPTFSFPGSGYAEEAGLGEARGTTLNIPLPPGADDNFVLKAIREQAVPAIEHFKPEILIVAAGFDGHTLDDMSGLNYSTSLYEQLGAYMNVWAGKYCNGKVLSILEGGYHLEALAASVEAYLGGLTVREDLALALIAD